MDTGNDSERPEGSRAVEAVDHVGWHRNGGATIYGTTSHVSHDSYCAKETNIIDSIIHNSSVFGQSRIDHSQVTFSSLDHVTAEKSFIADAGVFHSYLYDCIITSLKGARPSVRGVVLSGVVVEGDASLQGPWTLKGAARIPTGAWTRPPRYREIEGENLFVGLTESTDNHALIACMRKPVTQWLKAGGRLGKILGWQPEQVKEAIEFLTMLADSP